LIIKDLSSKYSKIEKNLNEVNNYLYKNPELGYEEFKSTKKIIEFLKKKADIKEFQYFSDIPTAFVGKLNIKKTKKENIAICIEYDALPGIGHACGHNIISSIGLGAMYLLSKSRNKLNTNITIVGCPAEEIIPLTFNNGGGGGKIKLIEKGVFQNSKAALMIHPATRNEVDPLMIAVKQVDIEFYGKTAHASGSPDVGKNALDAQILAYNSISVLRQQLKSTEKVHGIITHGGESANIIPDYTRSSWMIRAQKTEELKKLESKIINCFKSAGLATGCKVNIIEGNGIYENLITDKKLAKIFTKYSKELSIDMKTNKDFDQSKNGSTDFGNISKLIPSLHAFLAIVPDDGNVVNHQPEFAEATLKSDAKNTIKNGSILLAATILELQK
tara:strand:- start:715 stop:1878 length:1164 start_codon:yes stop_codon:yes gene_type:complete